MNYNYSQILDNDIYTCELLVKKVGSYVLN